MADDKITRLEVNLHPEVATALREEMARYGVSATEAIRRAFDA